MDLALSDEQEALVASFTELFGKHSSPEQVRAAEPSGHDPGLWELLLGTGVVEMAVPEVAGGWGASLLDLALVAECVGAALAPAPVLETQCAARLLAALGLRDALAPAVAGERMVTMAVRPASGRSAPLVPVAAVADDAVVRVDDRLVFVALGDDNRHSVANLASAPLADVDTHGGTSMVSGPSVVVAFERALDEWLTLTAAALVGMARTTHTLTCAYANERTTWGRLIGSYQAVAHPLADDLTAIDGAGLLAMCAASALDAGDERATELAAMAFAFASETARDVTYHGVHFHGGYGFVLEHDVQLFYRRARGWPGVWGDATSAYRRVADARYGIKGG